jgi:hypothetical protein
MTLRQRNRDGDEDPPAAVGAPIGGSDEARERARRLLELGDEAIRKALSSDSEQFLAQNRQQGGE